jgi:hypothetical protein
MGHRVQLRYIRAHAARRRCISRRHPWRASCKSDWAMARRLSSASPTLSPLPNCMPAIPSGSCSYGWGNETSCSRMQEAPLRRRQGRTRSPLRPVCPDRREPTLAFRIGGRRAALDSASSSAPWRRIGRMHFPSRHRSNRTVRLVVRVQSDPRSRSAGIVPFCSVRNRVGVSGRRA